MSRRDAPPRDLLPPTSGLGPPFEVADLPAPPPFSMANVLKVIGPGAILLATAIGAGEWLVGPVQAVKHGLDLFWIVTVAIGLQLMINLEGIRYTLYTGEPIYGGFLRLAPGPRFWGVTYALLAFLQLCLPALALLCANAFFSAWMGRVPSEGVPSDERTARWIAAGLILLVLAVLHFGGTVERMLERASWFMLSFIFLFLLVVNVLFIPLATWAATLRGFLGLAPGEGGPLDWGLLGALAATAGSGGVGNLTLTNWTRDKGFGMGALTGAIPSAVGSRKVQLSQHGKVFEATPENLQRWRVWMRYVTVDQVWVWALFCFVGMFLNVNLARGAIPAGTQIGGIAAGAEQAKYMAEHLWSGFWFLTLFNGFWILFSTQLGNTDILVRTVTDVLWLSSSRVRGFRGGDIRAIYYIALFGVSLFGFATLPWGRATEMFKVLGNMAGFVLAVASIQIILVNRRFLPRALRPPVWREAVLLAASAFYWFFTVRWLWSLVRPLP
ncbi:MAG: Nramp family divalent metal transporter [Planctomycetes bacterium]|nr:Nramp family divalent metal transporter [Planctomycetota bacterium]